MSWLIQKLSSTITDTLNAHPASCLPRIKYFYLWNDCVCCTGQRDGWHHPVSTLPWHFQITTGWVILTYSNPNCRVIYESIYNYISLTSQWYLHSIFGLRMVSMLEYLKIFLKVYLCVSLGPNSLTVVNLGKSTHSTQEGSIRKKQIVEQT